MKTTIAAAIAALLLPVAAQAQYYGFNASQYGQHYQQYLQQQRQQAAYDAQQRQIEQLQRQQFNSCRGNYTASYGCF